VNETESYFIPFNNVGIEYTIVIKGTMDVNDNDVNESFRLTDSLIDKLGLKDVETCDNCDGYRGRRADVNDICHTSKMSIIWRMTIDNRLVELNNEKENQT
jgi:hypothetical protein